MMASLVAALHFSKAPLVVVLITSAVMLGEALEYNLSYHNLAQIPQDIPSDVDTLNLGHNKIYILENDAFMQWYRLSAVKLDHNRLTSDEIGEYCLRRTQIRSLSLDSNQLSAVPRLSHDVLTNLSLNYNSISELGNYSMSGLPQLGELQIGWNKIGSIADLAFCGTVLQTIGLNGNYLTEVPDLRCVGDTLESLHLATNQICVIRSSDFTHLERLRVLHVQDNRLYEMAGIDVNIGHSIEVLKIQNNFLQVLNVDWSHFLTLQIINLTNNQIHTVVTTTADGNDGTTSWKPLADSVLQQLLLARNNLTCFYWVGVT